MISPRLTRRDSLLFVYGTLREFFAIPMARRLRREAQSLGVARVAGRLYDLGAYPGMTPPHGPDEWVIGELYRLKTPSRTLRALDRYECGPVASLARARFVRERVRALRAAGGAHSAWTYRFRGRARTQNRITSGDYRGHLLGAGEIA
jgi:gamma-glutamylcyclotransferase (GGCT)/AIG2-like uncharacterized protein YtfP